MYLCEGMLFRKIIISFYFIFVCAAFYSSLKAQVPSINSISKQQGTVSEKVIITGDNFPTNAGDLVVFFGSTAGNILNTSTNSIEVEVPAGTTTDNVVVINTANVPEPSSTALIGFGGLLLILRRREN